MRSNTSLYVGVYIWIASLEIRTKILIKILNNSYSPAKVLLFPDIRKFMNYIYLFSLGFSFAPIGYVEGNARSTPNRFLKATNCCVFFVRIFVWDYLLNKKS